MESTVTRQLWTWSKKLYCKDTTGNFVIRFLCKIADTLRRIFIFGALGYLELGALLEGLRRLMSYKLALHVLVTFTEQVVVLIHKHITLL